jgi:hypothetical protein
MTQPGGFYIAHPQLSGLMLRSENDLKGVTAMQHHLAGTMLGTELICTEQFHYWSANSIMEFSLKSIYALVSPGWANVMGWSLALYRAPQEGR